jgi:hypothetical protein
MNKANSTENPCYFVLGLVWKLGGVRTTMINRKKTAERILTVSYQFMLGIIRFFGLACFGGF